MNKKGQFYMVAAIIIVTIVMATAAVANYSKKESYVTIYDLKEELEIESAYVLDYDSMNGESSVGNFTKLFAEYVGDEIEIIFITGDKDNIESYKYVGGIKQSVDFTEENDQIKITISNIDYNFQLRNGENFYFIISQEIGREKYIITN